MGLYIRGMCNPAGGFKIRRPEIVRYQLNKETRPHTTKPRSPKGILMSAISFMMFKIQKSNCVDCFKTVFNCFCSLLSCPAQRARVAMLWTSAQPPNPPWPMHGQVRCVEHPPALHFGVSPLHGTSEPLPHTPPQHVDLQPGALSPAGCRASWGLYMCF